MANPFDYSSIEPLVANTSVSGDNLTVQFRCPQSGKSASASAEVGSAVGRIASKAAATAGSRMLYGARSALVGAIYRFGGSGILGRSAAEAAAGAVYGAGVPGTGAQGQISEDDRRNGVVAAFRKVSSQFRWDEAAQRWTGQPEEAAGGAFERQLRQHPLTEPYDKGLLVRMILAVVKADGEITDEEKEFARSFADPSLGNLDELVGQGPPSDVELDEASAGPVRETLLMAAWGAALCDESLDEAERAVLTRFAKTFGISSERAAELQLAAQTYILESALAEALSDRVVTEEERSWIFRVGQGLDMDEADVERCMIRYRKRLGLM